MAVNAHILIAPIPCRPTRLARFGQRSKCKLLATIRLGTKPCLTSRVDMAWRVNSYRDYGVANALGVVSLLMASSVAWIYLRHAAQEKGKTYG